MQSNFKSVHPNFYSNHPSFYSRDRGSRNQTCFAELGEFDHPVSAFHQDEAVDLSPSSMFGAKPGNVVVPCNSFQYGSIDTSSGGLIRGEGVAAGARCLDTGQLLFQESATIDATLVNGHIEHWGDSGMADNNQHTDTSTDIDTDDKNQMPGVQQGALVANDVDQSKARAGEQKTLRRLAQNREAARKSRLRKKAYVQQLENSRLRLTQLEQELQRSRQQGLFAAAQGDHEQSLTGSGALAFNLEYARWLDEHQRMINDLRSAVNTHMSDNELCVLVGGVMAHYDEIFKLKSVAAKTDVFHMLSGLWKTPAERFFMWLGGFRSSELLKILGNHLELLTDQQLVGICNLQQSSQQAEDALSQGMEALQQSLLETLSSASLAPGSANVADYMGQMAIAMSKLATVENFLHQADLLRQQTLHQLQRILTIRQSARAFLVISDYTSRLRALSSLWLARPRD